RTAVNDFMDSVHHIWCPLFSQEFQDLPDGAETTLTENPPVFTEKSHASIRCMALHAFPCLIFCRPRHSRRGLSVSVQLH
ncbi:hypothetical protein, partial [Escherichia coli]|uniref:hypothetical protein n=1 Tax=Escherichia coli TaxID=562 RepID=UPI001BC937C8